VRAGYADGEASCVINLLGIGEAGGQVLKGAARYARPVAARAREASRDAGVPAARARRVALDAIVRTESAVPWATRPGSLSAVPGALLAQLAVNAPFRGQGAGKVLVKHALLRIAGLADDWGCAAVVTDPIDDRARNLYRGFDFEPLREGSNRMIVATTMIAAIERGRWTHPAALRSPALI
jgi:GNAT superfamily N-acetyltransferase